MLEQVFEFIVDYKRSHDGCAPSFEEIMDGVEGLSSTSVVSYWLDKLEADERIEMTAGQNRSIRVSDGRWEYEGREQ